MKINGERHYLWRAVDHEGEVLESYATKTRDKKAALKFLKKAMRRPGRPATIVTDRLRSYDAALKEIGAEGRQETGRWANNRAETSHLPFRRRERAMLRFRRMRSLQMFATGHASVCNHFNQERSLSKRKDFKLIGKQACRYDGQCCVLVPGRRDAARQFMSTFHNILDPLVRLRDCHVCLIIFRRTIANSPPDVTLIILQQPA